MEITGSNLYDINKRLMANEDKLSRPAFATRMKAVENFFSKPTSKYYMLLCNELKDYTIFKVVGDEQAEAAIKVLKECLYNRGETLSIDKAPEDQDAFEIWMRDFEKEIYCYYLFPYDIGVLDMEDELNG